MVFLSNWKKSFGNKKNVKVTIKKEECEEKLPPEKTIRPKTIPAPVERERSVRREEPVSRYHPYGKVDSTKDLIDDIKRLEKAMEDYENSVRLRKK
jgi:hypothetical protein